MKLLNELMSIRRLDDEPEQNQTDQHDDELPFDDEFTSRHPDDAEGLNDVSDDMGRLDDKQVDDDLESEDTSGDNPHEEGTPEHEAWVAGYEAGMNHDEQAEQGVEQDAEMSGEELPDDIEQDVDVGSEDVGQELPDEEFGDEPTDQRLPVEDEEGSDDYQHGWADGVADAEDTGEKNPNLHSASQKYRAGYEVGYKNSRHRFLKARGRPVEDEELADPYEQGWEAHREGEDYTNNPYSRGTPEHIRWREGLLDCEEDEKIEHNKLDAEEDEARDGIKRPYEHDFNIGYEEGYGDGSTGDEQIGLERASRDYRNGYKQGYAAGRKVRQAKGSEDEETNPFKQRRPKQYNAWLDKKLAHWKRAEKPVRQPGVKANQRKGVENEEHDDVDFNTDKNWRDRYGRHEAPEDERPFSNIALTKGELAFNQGRDISQNPYDKGSLKSKEWLEGFRCGEQEASHRNASHWTGPGREADEDEESAIDKGYKACHDGRGREANPYPRGTEEYNDWLTSWEDADQSLQSDFDQEHQGQQDSSDEDEDCEVGTMMPRAYSDEEDEGENEWGGGAYDQQGAHMGGAKDTTVGEEQPDPDAEGEVDLNDALGDNEAGEEKDAEADPKLDALTDKTAEDPDRQGLVRKVKGAHLVYKRQIEDGTYEELWIYNSGNMRDELDVRKAVLAGTDIPTTKTTSPDGTQKYELWSAGNAEMLQIKGLPN